MAFSRNLRYLRKKYGLSQEELAEKLGYKSFTTIQKWESGVSEPSVSIVKDLSSLFDVSMDELINNDINDDYEPKTIAAHHDSEEWTTEELDEIEEFKRYVKSKRK